VDTLHEDLYTPMVISHWILLGMRSASDWSCRGSEYTQFVFSTFFSKNHAIYEIIWKSVVEPSRPHITIKCCIEKMCFLCWITQKTIEKHTHIIWYLLVHIWLIPSDLVKHFMATLTKTGQLSNDLHAIMKCLADFTSKEGHEHFFFQCSFYM
jgi:hypothetical protein